MATLLDLSKQKGVYIDKEDLITYGHYTASFALYGYIVIYKKGLDGASVLLHRELLPTNLYVDHINGNPSDNRKVNLREATHTQNLYNREKNCNNTSGYKGVSFHKNRKRYVAHIGYKNKQLHLGSFTTAKEAAEAYNKAATKLHGEFAKLNKV